jgi:hypothetical protein
MYLIVYYAGIDGHVTALHTAVKNGCRHLMLSYHYRKTYSEKQMKRFRKLGLHLFLDSGAFSAWKSGVKIDIDEFIKYIKQNHIGKYITLDVIGDPEKTYNNLKYMESQKLQPIPVFHLGSDFKYLQQLINEEYYYICLGGTVGNSRKKRIEFFDECFRRFPDTYFHGLGMTDPKLMVKYPWFSVDSTTWLIGRKMCKLQTMEKQITLPRDIPIQERLALNVQFFSNLEEKLS